MLPKTCSFKVFVYTSSLNRNRTASIVKTNYNIVDITGSCDMQQQKRKRNAGDFIAAEEVGTDCKHSW